MVDPLWRQIAENLRERVHAGEFAKPDPEGWRAAGQLPSEWMLQDHYGGTSRNTMRQAIEYLVRLRVVEKRPGRGTFVVETPEPFVTDLTVGAETETIVSHEGRTVSTSEPRVEIQRADAWHAAMLGIEPGEAVVVRHQRRYIDGQPFMLQTSFYPMAFVHAGAMALVQLDDIPGGAMAYLSETLGVEKAGTAGRISARPPHPSESEFFRLPDVGAVAMLVHRRTTYDGDGKPIRVAVTIYPADRNEFEMIDGHVPHRPYGEPDER